MRSVIVLLLLSSVVWAQSSKATPGPSGAEDISGMYNFLREGEFVQINLEDGRVTGFLSRYADEEKNPENFVDQFFDKASLDGKNLAFSTKVVHGIHFEFKGTVERGPGKARGDEGFFVLKGTITQYTADPSGQVSAKQREVELKSFPGDIDEPSPPPK